MLRRCLILSLALGAATGCGKGDAAPPAGSGAPIAVPPDATPAPDASALTVTPDGLARGPLPAHVDPRVDAVLAEAVPDDVILAYASIARGKSPQLNYRWNLDRAGKLYFVRRADNPDPTVAFDQPLPAAPSGKLDAWHLREVLATLKLHHVYDHPGYEQRQGIDGGAFVIVRARAPETGVLHTIVFENSRPELLDFLEAVTVAL